MFKSKTISAAIADDVKRFCRQIKRTGFSVHRQEQLAPRPDCTNANRFTVNVERQNRARKLHSLLDRAVRLTGGEVAK